jgi:predicted flap endonuclease-1-like 5' DNA nuclease
MIKENVSSEEYRTALRTFATDEMAAKMNQIHTLDELADITKGIGPALKAVTIAKGRFTPDRIR